MLTKPEYANKGYLVFFFPSFLKWTSLMFLNLKAARNGDILAICGNIEMLGNCATKFSLMAVGVDTAHVMVRINPPEAGPLNVLLPSNREVTELFTVTPKVKKVVLHVFRENDRFSYTLPL